MLHCTDLFDNLSQEKFAYNNFYRMITSFEKKEKIYIAAILCCLSIYYLFDERKSKTKEELINECMLYYNDKDLIEKIFMNLWIDREFFQKLCDKSYPLNNYYVINLSNYSVHDVLELKQYRSYIKK